MKIEELIKPVMWLYKATYTQTDPAGGSISIRLKNQEGLGTRSILWMLGIGPDVYAANRLVEVRYRDGANNVIGKMLSESLSNARRILPSGESTSINDVLSHRYFPLLIPGDDYVEMIAVGLAQNETFTISFRALILDAKPVLDTSDSTGTVTESVEYSKVV